MVERGQTISALCDHLRAHVPDLKLVKPYHGELDRYSKKMQLESEIFPAMVNLTTPFALIISKSRTRMENQGTSVKWRHDLSIYIGTANMHDFNNINVPEIFSLMEQVTNALQGTVLVKGAGALSVINDGEYLITSDLFTVYDMKFYQNEIGR